MFGDWVVNGFCAQDIKMPDTSEMPVWDSSPLLTNESYIPHALSGPVWYPPGMDPAFDASSDEETRFKLFDPCPSNPEDPDQYMGPD